MTYSNRILFFLTGFLTIGSVCATISVLSHTRTSGRLSGKNNVILFLDDSLSRQPYTFLRELHDAKINHIDVYKEDPVVGSIVRLLSEARSRTGRIKTDTTIGIEFPIRKPTSWDKTRVQALKEEFASNPPLERQKEIQEELNRIDLETNRRAGIDRLTPPLK